MKLPKVVLGAPKMNKEKETTTISCDGTQGSVLGHPEVYLLLPAGEDVMCPYCCQIYSSPQSTS